MRRLPTQEKRCDGKAPHPPPPPLWGLAVRRSRRQKMPMLKRRTASPLENRLRSEYRNKKKIKTSIEADF